MIARSKPNVDYNFLWECICGKGQQIDNTISNSFFFNSGASSLLFFLNLFADAWNTIEKFKACRVASFYMFYCS